MQLIILLQFHVVSSKSWQMISIDYVQIKSSFYNFEFLISWDGRGEERKTGILCRWVSRCNIQCVEWNVKITFLKHS